MNKQTADELMEHSRKCYKMKQLAIFVHAFTPTPELTEAIQLWQKAGERAEHRADCIYSGKGDPTKKVKQ